MKLSQKQLKLILTINYLALTLFVVLSLIHYMNNKGIPQSLFKSSDIQKHTVKIVPSSSLKKESDQR